jgi:hypothetical protein
MLGPRDHSAGGERRYHSSESSRVITRILLALWVTLTVALVMSWLSFDKKTSSNSVSCVVNDHLVECGGRLVTNFADAP